MATKTSTEPTWLMAHSAVCVIVGARPKVYETAIVRDRHSGRLVEVELNPERPPLDEGDEGQTFVFKRGERVLSDHPACITSPGSFVPYIPPQPGE
jgi:hypothetical protein